MLTTISLEIQEVWTEGIENVKAAEKSIMT